MKKAIKKQDGVPEEATMMDAEAVAPEEISVEDRLSSLEAKTEEILSLLQTMGKADESEEEEESEEETEKSVIGDEVSPAPDGGEVKLPKATVGETDEDAPKETDEVSVMEKKMQHIQKSRSVTRAVRPGLMSEEDEEKQAGFVHKFMKDVREGRKTLADMNREIRDIQKAKHAEGISKALGRK